MGRGIFVVCDGMGGQAAGEVASKIAVDSLLKYFQEAPRNKGCTPATNASENISPRAVALAESVQLANKAIREAACRDEGQAGMGSTVACVLVDDNICSIGHVGD